jgi:hypothetical protein
VLVGAGLDIDEEVKVEVKVVSGVEGARVLGIAPEEDIFPLVPAI